MIKRILASLSLALGALLPVAAGAAPALPAECTGTYTTTIERSGNAQSIKGTAGNDYIIVNGNRNSVYGLGGNDCIVINGTGNSVKGGTGNDVIIDNVGGNSLKGEDGNDYLSSPGNSSLNGGAGVDTCESDEATSSEDNCEF